MKVSEPWSVDGIYKSTLRAGEGHTDRCFGLLGRISNGEKKGNLLLNGRKDAE